MCWFLKMRLARRKRAAEQTAQALKTSMHDSFNKITSSMSMAIGGNNSKDRQPGHPSGRGTPGPRGSGIGRGGSRGSRSGGVGPGRGLGRPLGRPHTSGVNTPISNPKATSQKQKPSPAKKKEKTKKQKKGKGKDTSMALPETTSTLPTLCRFFKKPERQKGVRRPSQRIRRNFMRKSWQDGVADLSILHDIAEEDEDEN